eukprot:672269-Rhodomonas_salina.1
MLTNPFGSAPLLLAPPRTLQAAFFKGEAEGSGGGGGKLVSQVRGSANVTVYEYVVLLTWLVVSVWYC